MSRPAIGATVELVKVDYFLANYHHVTPGSLGIVTAHSALCADDDGVLVDWGDGKRVRCQLDEIKTSTRIKKDNQMSKTFKDVRESLDNVLAIGFDVNGLSLRTVTDSQNVGVVLAPSDAPAVMLAIGEATGVEPALEMYSKYGTPEHLAHIQWHLHEYVKAQEATAAAEADRVKLEQEALALFNASRIARGLDELDWVRVTPSERAEWLAVARAARELNKEAGQ